MDDASSDPNRVDFDGGAENEHAVDDPVAALSGAELLAHLDVQWYGSAAQVLDDERRSAGSVAGETSKAPNGSRTGSASPASGADPAAHLDVQWDGSAASVLDDREGGAEVGGSGGEGDAGAQHGDVSREAANAPSPSLPAGAIEQPGGGVVIGLRAWLSQLGQRGQVTSVAAAMPDLPGGGVDQVDSGAEVTSDGAGVGDAEVETPGDLAPPVTGSEAPTEWMEDADGFVVEQRAGGSLVQTWVRADVSDSGDVAPTVRGPGGRRRRKNADGGRMHPHFVKVTPFEEAKLQAMARMKGVSIPRLLIEAAFAPDTQTISDRRKVAAELMQLDRVVSGVAVNMNQIAKSTNTGYELPADFVATQAALRSILSKIDNALELLTALNARDLAE